MAKFIQSSVVAIFAIIGSSTAVAASHYALAQAVCKLMQVNVCGEFSGDKWKVESGDK